MFARGNATSADDLRNAIDQKTKELERINAEITKTEGNLNQAQTQSKGLSKDVTKLSNSIAELNLRVQAGEVTIEKLRLELEGLDNNIDYLSDTIGKKKDGIAALLRTLQQKDAENMLMAVLKSSSLADGVLEAQSISNMNNFLSDEIGNLKSMQETLNKQMDEVNNKKGNIEQQTVNTKNQAAIANDQKSERQQLLSLSKSQEKSYTAKLDSLQKQQQDLALDIDNLEAELKAKFNQGLLPAARPGVFTVPVQGKITQAYGATPDARRLYKSGFHNGLDIGAPLGTPIYAARDGKVIAVKNNGRLQYGKYVMIEHDNGLSTMYSHMSRQVATEGATIKRGGLIGYVGDTGYAFGYHLHFGVYWSASVVFRNFPGAGMVPVGVTVSPQDYI